MKKDIDILLIGGGNSRIKSAIEHTNDILKILLNITDNIHLVTSCNNDSISELNNKNIHSIIYYKDRFRRFLYTQLLESKAIFSMLRTHNIKTVLFAFGQDLSIIPVILAKIVAKRVIIRSDGRPTVVLKKYYKNQSPMKWLFFKIIEEINYRLADIVLTECEYMILENDFQGYNSRTGSYFVDINRFLNRIDLHNRTYEIGFVGNLNREKGILDFLDALELLNRSYSVIIKGVGEEKDNVLDRIQTLKRKGKVSIDYVGWVERSKLPNHLTEIKLLVLPTYREGLPIQILEAMACGCVVLATSVGGIPGVIKDGETGFILENTTPECIVKNITRALEYPNLCEIVKNARQLIEKDFTYEVAVERYKEILVNNVIVE
jgi:glycosyltransferase involved in cell wall biosynthesis